MLSIYGYNLNVGHVQVVVADVSGSRTSTPAGVFEMDLAGNGAAERLEELGRKVAQGLPNEPDGLLARHSQPH